MINFYNSSIWKVYAKKENSLFQIFDENQEREYREKGFKIIYTKENLSEDKDKNPIEIPKEQIKVNETIELEVNPCLLYSVMLENGLSNLNKTIEHIIINHIKNNGINYKYNGKIFNTKSKS